MSYRDALAYIYSFTNFEVTPAGDYSSKTFDLTRMERLLAALGNPQHQFRSVHVAGTKGKGSTAAMIESVLRAANQRTGLYTSPHLHTFRERIRVGDAMISQDAVIAGVEKIKPLAAQIPGITTFEIMTALAFDYFRVRGVEIAVLEVGLGGRLDATNVVTPLVSVITSISYDHTAILGNTLAQIAREKAGIIKPGVPVVASPQPDEALSVIQATAREQSAPLVAVSSDLEFQVADAAYQLSPVEQDLDGQRLTFTRQSEIFDLSLFTQSLRINLLGKHQMTNAATALAALMVLRDQGVAISDDALRDGLANVEWHGRFEIISRDPFIILDGAHNADSARQLVGTLHDVFPNARLHFIFGASGDKDIAGMFAELLPAATSLILTRSRNPRAADPARLADLAAQYRVETFVAPEIAMALHDAQQRARRADVVCITGSLFVVAQARETWLIEHGGAVEKD
ncbi:MAG TPA: folylpolyglutamate synthase/dihydrofolate synthase family protein [Anaerolineae bacterium]